MENLNCSYSPINMNLIPSDSKPKTYRENQVDMNDLYSKEELNALIGKFDCLHPKILSDNQECKFDTVYLPDSGTIVINNRNMTNDTVEIDKNGRAISVGSWHSVELEGDFSDIVNDVKSRITQNKSANAKRLDSQMDSLAELGKSQVVQKK